MNYTQQQLTEIRKQIFPRYIGSNETQFGKLDLQTMFVNVYTENSKLQLFPLSSITDEHAESICEIKYGFRDSETGKRIIRRSCSVFNNSVHQSLQLKGYALPQLVILDGKPVTLSVEEQIELGIIELKK